MKKSLLFLAASALAFASCTEALDYGAVTAPNDENLVSLSISTEKPEAVDTRTMVAEDGKTPMWCPGDAIGVSVFANGSYTNHEFTSECLEASKITTFTGKTAVGDLIYTYYPYSEAGVTSEGKAMVAIPAVQNPASTSFDGAADILVGKPVVMNPEAAKIEGLQFKRVGGFLKIVINDQSGMLAEETFSKISVTAESELAGDVYLDIVNGQLGEIYANGSKTVTANCASDCEDTAWLGVYPQTLAESSTITIAATTDSYDIERSISLPYDIEIKEGQITTLNIKITAENISEKSLDIEEAFPDPIFRQYVSDNIDTNHDGKLSKEEILAVNYIDVGKTSSTPDDEKIASLAGIEHFPNLNWLGCGYNKLTNVDVSKNAALWTFMCSYNPMIKLDLTHNPALGQLECIDNQLTSLDVTHNTELTWLRCDNNQLTNLNVSKNTKLDQLYIYNNQFTSLDVTNNPELTWLGCSRNNLTSLDLSKNTKLLYLYASGNQLKTLDLLNHTALKLVFCDWNQLMSLDVSGCPALESLVCYVNQLTTLDVSNTNLGNSTYSNPLNCAHMPTLETLYLKTGWSIDGITPNRSTDYIPEQTKIVFISGDYGEDGGSGGDIGDGGDHDL